ncbi:hypothetical protein GCM10009821_27480 [Aeromicrobium halocynthiae]|uniref:Toprim domain-containing protein n=1 Tax=Aeromicrobium halocynthiae TaxID=560557 RepID=A0ABP5HT59_9ACTN
MAKPRRQPLAIYVYQENGDPFARKKKFVDEHGEKDFLWEHVTGWDERGEYVWSPRVPKEWDVGLYRADELKRARSLGLPVHIAEGEKDAEHLAKDHPDWVVASRPHGAKAWRSDWHRGLNGVPEVYIYADDDSEGHAGAARAARALEADNFKVTIRLPAQGSKDVYEHLKTGHGDAWRKLKREDWPPEQRATQRSPAHSHSDPTDTQQLLGRAAGRVVEHGRNDTGFWLACQLRDSSVPRAEVERVLVEQYVPTANAIVPKSSLYTEDEARESVRQAFSQEAREPAANPESHETWDDFGNAQRLVNLYGDRLK